MKNKQFVNVIDKLNKQIFTIDKEHASLKEENDKIKIQAQNYKSYMDTLLTACKEGNQMATFGSFYKQQFSELNYSINLYRIKGI